MDIQKDLLHTEVGQGSLKSMWPWPGKKKKTKGTFNKTKKQKDKHQIKKMNTKAKGYRKCFGFLAEDGTCVNDEASTT